MKHLCKHIVLAVTGGITYGIMEAIWRGYTHWTMMVLGGALFIVLGGINEYLDWEMPIILQGVVGSAVVTIAEFMAGVVLNICLGLSIWDYSHLPFNIYGQICLPFSLLWVGVSIFAVVLDDWLRYRWFGEEKPCYIFYLTQTQEKEKKS